MLQKASFKFSTKISCFSTINMFSFNDTTSLSQNPSSCNPNITNQLNDSQYLHIANYLMSDFDDESDKNIVMINNKDAYEDNCSRGSSNSVSNMKSERGVKKYDTREEFRFAFRTKTDLEIMDDGYKWRKYGKKMVKNSPNPRNYFKCSSEGCKVKKRVERESEDPSYVITTYQGIHNHHSPTYNYNCILYPSSKPHSLVPLPSSVLLSDSIN